VIPTSINIRIITSIITRLTLEALPPRGGGSGRCPKRTGGEQEESIGGREKKVDTTKIILNEEAIVN